MVLDSSPATLPSWFPSLDEGSDQGRWAVVIYNNDTTSFEDVIFILVTATGCDVQEATIEAWEAHHFGKAMVHFSTKVVCEEACRIIGTVGVKAEVRPEWNE